jgi:Domain of unknown function (DUF5668)
MSAIEPPPPGPSRPGPWTPGWRPPLRTGTVGMLLPVLLIAVGVIAILLNFGWIPGARLLRAFDLWPLVLVVAGLGLVFRALLEPPLARSLTVAVTVLALVGIVAYVVLAPPVPAATSTAGTVSTSSSAPLNSAASGRLQIESGATSVDVHGGAGSENLYEARFDFPQGHAPEVQVNGGNVVVRGRGGTGLSLLGQGKPRTSIALNSSIPWDVEVGGGASQADLDLRGLDLRSLKVDSGASHLDVHLPSPRGTVEVDVSGGATSVDIARPRGVPVQARVSGGASNLEVDSKRVATLGGSGVQTSAGWGSTADRYDISISGGANNVDIKEE